MDLFAILLPLIVVGVVLWAVNMIVPMDPKFKQIVNVVALLCVALWLVQMFFGQHGTMRIHP